MMGPIKDFLLTLIVEDDSVDFVDVGFAFAILLLYHILAQKQTPMEPVSYRIETILR